MSQIEQDLAPEHTNAPPSTRRWRRLGLVAAAVAVGLGLAMTTSVVGGSDRASANTAVRTADGGILISINEGKHPKQLQRRLNDLGVPAVVDFLKSGFGCDPARSTAWVQQPAGEALFGHAPGDDPRWVLHPDQLEPGQTLVFEFQIDEHGDDIAANVNLREATGPVGACVPVPNGSIVDAEHHIAGG
jgi:hypothetical protein